jgi:hypothetical protein
LPDFIAWLLFLLGLVFAIISMFDGLKADDTYPGYGRIVRKVENTESDYATLKDSLIDDLNEIKNDAEQKIIDSGKDIDGWSGSFRQLISRCEALRGSFDSHLGHIESVGNALLQAYRSKNSQHRTTETPIYFQARWKLERPDLSADDGLLSELLRANEKTLAEISTEMIEKRKALFIEFDASILKYRRIDEIVDLGQLEISKPNG